MSADAGGERTGPAVPVSIFGQSYSLRSDEEPAYLEDLAALVDQRMREVAERTRTADTAKIAVLAALNLADQLRRAEAREADGRRDLETRADAMAAIVDAGLASRP
jgi:cell division protein ZapA